MDRPPPAANLFPYTTLFRSLEHVDAAQQRRFARAGGADDRDRLSLRELAIDALEHLGRAIALAQAADRKQRRHCYRTEIDRKSTRLNSSHGYISYAVFCLKK